MEIGRVTGQVVATVRDPRLPLCSLLLVEMCDAGGRPTGTVHVATDPLGAGEGEWVLLTRGSSARQGMHEGSPVDLCVVGIVDEVTSSGAVLYSNAAPASSGGKKK